MCGLVAIYSMENNGFSVEQGNIFEQSMLLNQFRGDDSTGAVCITNKDEFMFIKALGGYRALNKHPQWDEYRRKVLNDGRLVFGHGRWATRGSVNLDNAHPFLIERKTEGMKPIVFMHNGTLDSSQDLGDMWKYSVDSLFLGTMIAEHGGEKALSEVFGAKAVLWWDDEDKTFNFFRNDERPLHYMYNKKGEFYINSEKWVLEWLNYKFKLGIPDKHIYMLNDQEWNILKANGDGSLSSKKIKKAKKIVQHWPHHEVITPWSGSAGSSESYGNYSLKPPEIKAFWDRDIETIEWRDGRKIVTYKNRTIAEYKAEPPELNLVRMFEHYNGNIQKVYKADKEGDPAIFVTVFYEDFKKQKEEEAAKAKPVAALVAPATKKQGDNLPNNISRKGQSIRFTTRLQPTNEKVKHVGECLVDRGYPFLKEYSNSNDGLIRIGQKVYMEVLYVEDRNDNLRRVVCARIKEKQDHYIDCQFFTSKMSKKEVEDSRFFEGEVAALRIMTKDEIKSSGAWICASMSHVQPVKEPSNEAAAEVESIH